MYIMDIVYGYSIWICEDIVNMDVYYGILWIWRQYTITLAAARNLCLFLIHWPSRFTHRKFMANMGNTHNISYPLVN